MLYETLAQPTIFFCICLGGFFSGIIFDLKTILTTFFKKNRFFCHFFMFLASFFVIFLFFVLNLKLNFGEFRLYTVFTFLLAFCIERFFVSNFVAKPVAKCYNIIKGKINERRTARAKKNQTENCQN